MTSVISVPVDTLDFVDSLDLQGLVTTVDLVGTVVVTMADLLVDLVFGLFTVVDLFLDRVDIWDLATMEPTGAIWYGFRYTRDETDGKCASCMVWTRHVWKWVKVEIYKVIWFRHSVAGAQRYQERCKLRTPPSGWELFRFIYCGDLIY
jgi:hypothetical protein